MLKRRYKIVGVIEEPVFVRLVLQADDVLTVKPPKMDLPVMAGNMMSGNFGPLIQQIQQQTQAKLGRDTICVTYEDQKQNSFKNGDIISIDVEREK